MSQLIELPTGLSTLRRVPFPRKLGILERLFGKTLANHGICWVRCSNGVEWKLDLTDATQRWIVYGDYEGSAFLNWMRKWMKPGGVYIDSGANIGQMLLYLAPLPNVRVIAFEPLPEAAQWLKECVVHNAMTWQVKLVNKGLSSQRSSIDLQCDGARSTMRQDWYQNQALETVSVPVDTFDHQLDDLGIDHVRLWKLDVEGTEVEALAGAEESLKESAVDALVVEVCPPNLRRVHGLLGNSRYRLFQLDRNGSLREPPDSLVATTNLLALSPKAAAS